MTDLATIEQAGVFFPGVQLIPTALLIDNLDESQWTECGKFLWQLHGASLFWLGDWLNYGESNWGEKYELAEQTGYDQGTLRNAVFVCKSIDLSRRRDKLPYSHHAEVAK